MENVTVWHLVVLMNFTFMGLHSNCYQQTDSLTKGRSRAFNSIAFIPKPPRTKTPKKAKQKIACIVKKQHNN